MSTLELLILAPTLLVVFAAGLQLGLYYLAENTAHTAARKGAGAASSSEAGPAAGVERANRWLAQVGLVKDADVSSAGSTADRVRITVSGRVTSLLPGMTFTVTQSAEQPVERAEVTP